jgi:chemotaxis protein CheX
VQVDMIHVVIKAALDVIRQECGGEANAGAIKLQSSAQTSEEVTVMIGVSGDVRGMVLLGMSVQTALNIVSRMMGEECRVFDELAQSGIAEMGNVITGLAGQGLEAAGFSCTISPPALVAGGPGIIISTVNIRRFVVPLITDVGNMVLHAALEQGPELPRRTNGYRNAPAITPHV